MSPTRPNVFEYLDYRQFLKNLFEFKKSQATSFSHRLFARLAGLKSSNFLKLVIDGKRNLSLKGISQFAKAFKLSAKETDFFQNLVLFNQSATTEEKNRYFEKILQSKSYHEVKHLEASQYAYFSNWYLVALRELVRLPGFREDPNWINRKLKIKLAPSEVKKALEVLLELKLIRRDTHQKLHQTDQKLVTPSEIADLTVLNFHREMMRKAMESLETSRTVHRDISALTLTVTKEQYLKIRERLAQVRREILALASEGQSPEAVYQLNLQLFNLSDVPWKD